MSLSKKLPSIHNSIFYQKLKEVQLRPDKTCFAYILPHNCWLEMNSIIDLQPHYVTFSYTGTMDDAPYIFEETIKIDSIKSLKIGIPLPHTEEEARTHLDDVYKINMETGENATTNKEN